MTEKRRLKIVGTDMDLIIKGCYECPLFNDGVGFEYDAQCRLTNEDGGHVIVDMYDDEPRLIISKCPLPKVKSDDGGKRVRLRK